MSPGASRARNFGSRANNSSRAGRRSSSATPEPALSLDLPEVNDPRVVTVSVTPDIGAEGGTFTVVVSSATSERIDELAIPPAWTCCAAGWAPLAPPAV
mgnify:CR=1 FL=1